MLSLFKLLILQGNCHKILPSPHNTSKYRKRWDFRGISCLVCLKFPFNFHSKARPKFSEYALTTFLFYLCQHCEQLELDLLETDLPIPVYFAHENNRLSSLYEEITSAVNGDTATSALKGNFQYDCWGCLKLIFKSFSLVRVSVNFFWHVFKI